MKGNFRDLINRLEDVIFIHLINEDGTPGKMVKVNAVACRTLGYTYSEMLSMTPVQLGDPAVVAQSPLIVHSVLNHDVSVFEDNLLHKQGHRIPFEMKSYLEEYDGNRCIYTIGRDLRQHRETLSQLKAAYDELDYVFNASELLIIVLDINGKIISVNQTAVTRLGYTAAEMKGADIELIHSQESRDDVSRLKSQFDKGDKFSCKAPLLKREGGIIPVESRLIRGHWHGQDVYYCMSLDISELSRLKDEAMDSVNRLEAVLDSAKLGYWEWDLLTDNIIVNERWAEILGYSLKELQPTTIDTWKDILHPDDLEHALLQTKKHIDGLSPHYEITARMRHKKGHWVWVQDSGRITLRDKQGRALRMNGIHLDVTRLVNSRFKLKNRYRIEKVLADISASFINVAEETIDLKLDNALQIIGEFAGVDRAYFFLFKDEGRIMDNSHEWVASGVSAEKNNLRDLPSSIFPWWMQKLNRLEHIYARNINEDLPKEATMERDILKAQNILSVLVVPVHLKDNLMGFLGFDAVAREKEWSPYDIKILKTIAGIIAQSMHSVQTIRELIAARNKAEESNRLKSAFLATINHELRTPLNHIMGFSDIMHAMATDQDFQEYSKLVNESGRHLLALIEDIFELALSEQSAITIREQSFRGMDILSENKLVLEDLIHRSGKTGKISLRFSPEKSLLLTTLTADRSKINQVLNNLFRNAVKFTREGFVEFGFYRESANRLTFFVQDSGIGIPVEKQDIIFDFFRQVDDSHTRRYEGVGIGLALSRRIVQAMQGEIRVESDVNEGSRFSFTVPVAFENAGVQASMPGISGSTDFSGLKVLVAEDDQSSRMIIRQLLKPSKVQMLFAENGLEAVDLVRSIDRIDLVLMDLKMPVMDGYQATREIRQLNPDLRIIALTAHTLPEDRESAFAAGCNGVITKPVDKEMLFKELQQLLS